MPVYFKLFLTVLGLTVPGYGLARLLRVERPWIVAFPLSCLLMVETIIFFAITGIPIRLVTMAGALILGSTAWYVARNRSRPLSETPACFPEGPDLSPRIKTAILATALILLATVTLRTTLFPLRGYDTSFRWEGLAIAILQQQSLDFYPPVSAGDYAIYLYPDGIPPLVATIYWWIYAVLGAPLAQATSIAIALQLAVVMALVFHAALHAFGVRAAWFALLAAACTPLLTGGIAIGQETGFTAISVAGQLCFAWLAVRNPKLSTVVVVALFAALGAMARDYGPALALTGLAVIAWHQETRRYLPAFLLTVVLLAAPWYLRNWALTGNPFFSHRLPGGFPVNAVHAAIMDYYKETYSFARLDRSSWLQLGRHLLTGGFFAGAIGIPALLVRFRSLLPFLAAIVLITLLWVYSVGQTAGGVIFSTRVLTPAAAVLAIITGMALGRIPASATMSGRAARFAGRTLLPLIAGYAVVSAALYPAPSQVFFTVPSSTAEGSLEQKLARSLDAMEMPATGVLMDSPFAAETMKRESRFRPVMYWSPEANFAFDRKLGIGEIHRRLLANGIQLVMVDQFSPNNAFLAGFDFFRERTSWEPLYLVPGEAGIFYFAPP